MARGGRTVFWTAIVLSLVSAFAHIQAGSALEALALNLEKEIGSDACRQVLAERPPARLPAWQEARLNRIFARLVAGSRRRSEIGFTLTVIEDPTINAFALPGGYIFLHEGLLSIGVSDDELAGVMAHEIAHVELKHGMRKIYRTMGFSLLLQILVNRSDSGRSREIRRIGAAAINLAMLGYGREAEYEADRCAVALMRRAGFDKGGLLHFLHRLQENNGGRRDSAFARILSTHPPLAERIERIEAI